MSIKDVGLISDAVASLNKFANDGDFMHGFMHQQNIGPGGPPGSSSEKCVGNVMSEPVSLDTNQPGEGSRQAMSANQLAAKALRLRMEGKHEEAEELLVRYYFTLQHFLTSLFKIITKTCIYTMDLFLTLVASGTEYEMLRLFFFSFTL